MFNLKKASEHEPLKDHQSQLYIAASRRCEVQLIIKDDVGDNFISDPIIVPRLTAKNFPKSTFLSNIKPIRFPVCDLKSKSWSYMGTGPKQNIKFPVRAAGLRFSTSSAKTIHLKFDQLTAHDVQLEQHLRYQRWITASPVLKHQLTQESYDWKAFLPHDGWGVRSTHGYGIEHLLSTRTTKTPPQIISSLRSALIRAEERYLKNLKAWETLQRLDKKTNKTLDDFWKDADKRHQVGPEPKILDFISDQRGLRLHIQWPASQNLKPWERFGHSSILLEGYACSQPQLFLSEQTQALLCELKSSPLQGSSLCFAFESSLGATYLHNINLADGDVQNVILNVHHIRSKLRKQHKKDEAFHIRLKMVSIELLHSKHHQEAEQYLHIRPLKAIFKK
jgi:hypothetical protein